MAERTRPIRIEFCVTEQERRLIQNKMAQLGTRNMGLHHQGGLHPAEETGRSRQPGCQQYQPDLPPHQQHRAFLC